MVSVVPTRYNRQREAELRITAEQAASVGQVFVTNSTYRAWLDQRPADVVVHTRRACSAVSAAHRAGLHRLDEARWIAGYHWCSACFDDDVRLGGTV